MRIIKIAVIDADLIGRKKHNFPNLTCMKISGYYKDQGHDVSLKMDYQELEQFDKVYISKVFTDTLFDDEILKKTNVHWGGTGFFFDKAPNLPDEIEHTFPDYHLYDDFVKQRKAQGLKVSDEYTDYSIGYLTRGCFRKCGFCVNQKYDRVFAHSPLTEFLDPDRKKICLLDDNFLGYPKWKELLQELIATGKRFKFKQGLDERLLTDEKCELLFNSKYDSELTFAFDKLSDYKLIEQKLQLIRKHNSSKQITFYVLCGYDESGVYDHAFWQKDIESIFQRIDLLTRYKAMPYLMRFNKYKESPIVSMYNNLAAWINQRAFFKKKSCYEFSQFRTKRNLEIFLAEYPDFNQDWLNWKYEEVRS